MLICSADSTFGKQVKETIVPAIAYLRKRYPVSLDLFFGPTCLSLAGEGTSLDATDIAASDRVFDSFGYE